MTDHSGEVRVDGVGVPGFMQVHTGEMATSVPAHGQGLKRSRPLLEMMYWSKCLRMSMLSFPGESKRGSI